MLFTYRSFVFNITYFLQVVYNLAFKEHFFLRKKNFINSSQTFILRFDEDTPKNSLILAIENPMQKKLYIKDLFFPL